MIAVRPSAVELLQRAGHELGQLGPRPVEQLRQHRRLVGPRDRVALDAVDAPCVLLEYAGELRAMQENWPKIKFHALREHAGLVFQKQLEG